MIFHGQVVLPPHRIWMIRIFLILFTVRIYTMIRMSRETYNWAAHGAQSWARLRCVWPLIQPTPELSSTTLTPWTQPTNSTPASMGEAIANPSNEPQIWIDFLRLWIYGTADLRGKRWKLKQNFKLQHKRRIVIFAIC